MFWAATVVFVLLAVSPFAAASILNRMHGDTLSDASELSSEGGAQ